MSRTPPWGGRWRAGLAPLLSVALLLVGCSPKGALKDQNAPPFVFRSLNLRQQDRLGRPAWELTSPEARYDLRRRMSQALAPKGVIFKAGKPLYTLQADSATVINDGEVILLEGDIRLRRLGAQVAMLRGSRLRWLPGEKIMEIDREPEAFDRQTRVTADRARFLLDRDQLQLRGNPLLQRWSRPHDSDPTGTRKPPEIEVKVQQIDWEPGTGALVASGPVRGTRRPAGAPASRLPQTLSARGLTGNTVRQEFQLAAPVRIEDGSEAASLDAGLLEIDLKRNTLSSSAPFSGVRGPLRVSGGSLSVDGGATTVRILSQCAIERPEDSLHAERCSWNWSNQAVEAQGSVVARREANHQITRGDLLKGHLGKEGELTVSSSTGRVVSAFQVPQKSRPKPPAPSTRRKPDPIQL